jgi:hypothetical protein
MWPTINGNKANLSIHAQLGRINLQISCNAIDSMQNFTLFSKVLTTPAFVVAERQSWELWRCGLVAIARWHETNTRKKRGL